MSTTIQSASFDVAAARRRCLTFRRRMLDISQTVSALHMAPAFSCLEIVDVIYHGLMRQDGKFLDTFIMSKGHGCMAQYVVLESLGILGREELAKFCKPEGRLGVHPDYGVPGIEASTGSLGHGLSIGVGMAYAEKVLKGSDSRVYVVLSDGEVQEGSTWEAVLMGPTLGVQNLIAFIDYNDFQSLGRISESHPNFHPLPSKLLAFGWEVAEVNGHDASELYQAVVSRDGTRPMMIVCRTIKGRGVSFMENVPLWHYRSPNAEEYARAVAGLEEVTM